MPSKHCANCSIVIGGVIKLDNGEIHDRIEQKSINGICMYCYDLLQKRGYLRHDNAFDSTIRFKDGSKYDLPLSTFEKYTRRTSDWKQLKELCKTYSVQVNATGKSRN